MIVVASAVQLAMMGHMAKKAYKGTLKGYVAGSYDGEVKGSADAQLMVSTRSSFSPSFSPALAFLPRSRVLVLASARCVPP